MEVIRKKIEVEGKPIPSIIDRNSFKKLYRVANLFHSINWMDHFLVVVHVASVGKLCGRN
jgi:hypothetical protein